MNAVAAGGMGTVYRAWDAMLQRQVAIKIVHLDLQKDVPSQELGARFRNEARAVARLNHPAIVTIFDFDDKDPTGAYIAMEFVEGCALDEYVKQRPERHLEDAVSAMDQVLGGLAYAHGENVVHRDVKPSNLLVTRLGQVKITDFGIAKIGPRSQTQTGFQVGTPQYMAPEQYTGGVVDHRCDIHAAGVVLYELLAGSPPYLGTSAEVMYKICNEKPKPLSSVDPSIPKAFDPLVAKALEKLPANRYASAADFQQALRSSWQSISPKPPSATLSQQARDIATTISTQTQAPQGEQGSLVAWSREQLLEIERELIPFFGALAPILVRDAAAATASRRELYGLLAERLKPEDRRRFQERMDTGSGASTPPGASNEVLISGSGRPLTPEATERACKLLARYLGSMAEMVTRKAAQTAVDEAQLYSMLAQKVTDGADRKRFLAEAGRGR